jgi:hypothetical protein
VVKVIILIVTGVLALIAQSVYFLKDDRTANTDQKDKPIKIKWHVAGGVIHGWMFFIMADSYGNHWGAAMASLTWLLFDGAVNTYTLHKEFFYIGNTALIDRAQREATEWINKLLGTHFIDPRLFSAVLKVGFVLYSIISLILHYGRL